MSEDLTDFLRDHDVKVEYLHSDIDAIEEWKSLEISGQENLMCW